MYDNGGNTAPKPLLRYAEELRQSYLRLLVYSGDILRVLPGPHDGLSAANIKTKREESSQFQREWQHLEWILDGFLNRLNDIRERAHEELDAARVRCLVGEDVDLTLPEAAARLAARLARYRRQYDALQQVLAGASADDLASPAAGGGAVSRAAAARVPAQDAPPSSSSSNNNNNNNNNNAPDNDDDNDDDNDALVLQDPEEDGGPIEVGSGSEIDDDAMEDIFE